MKNKKLLVVAGVGIAALAAAVYYKKKIQPAAATTSDNGSGQSPIVRESGYDGSGINPQSGNMVVKPSKPVLLPFVDSGAITISEPDPVVILQPQNPRHKPVASSVVVDPVFYSDNLDQPHLRGVGNCYIFS